MQISTSVIRPTRTSIPAMAFAGTLLEIMSVAAVQVTSQVVVVQRNRSAAQSSLLQLSLPLVCDYIYASTYTLLSKVNCFCTIKIVYYIMSLYTKIINITYIN